jgi:hypothetical protein
MVRTVEIVVAVYGLGSCLFCLGMLGYYFYLGWRERAR